LAGRRSLGEGWLCRPPAPPVSNGLPVDEPFFSNFLVK
jgi:hypothetical protein